MNKSLRLIALAVIAALMVAACGAGATPTPAPTAAPTAAASEGASAAPSAAPTSPAWSFTPDTLLGKVVAAGKIRISTDPNYAPFSFYDTATSKYVGFDTSTAEEVVKRMNEKLGTNIALEWVTPSWDLITAGNWGGRWDMSIGSMSVTIARQKVVDFADPYYYDYGSIAVATDSPVQTIKDLDGKSICVGAATTYESWLNGTLEIPGEIVPPPAGATITSLPTDNECVQAFAAGRKFDALVANENSLGNAVKQNMGLRILDLKPPPFIVQVSFALDKSGPPTAAMLALLNQIVADMHADGTLKAFSMEFLGKDVTTKPE